jgi:hypothetical protein
MRLKSLLWACVLSFPIAVAAQTTTVSTAPDAPSREDIRKLLDIMSSKQQIRQMMEQTFAQMRAMNREQMKKRRPDVSEEELARSDRPAENLIKNFPLDEMLNDIIPIYQKHFSKSDIDGLTAFYSSATGQKFLHEMPAVTGEVMRAMFPRIQASVEEVMKSGEKSDAPQK